MTQTTEQCLHVPEPSPGRKCDCLQCRTARMRAFQAIAVHCTRCAGRCATDGYGGLACEKGDYGCPVLDLWCACVNREVDPSGIGPAEVELVYHRRKAPPKVYPRVPPSDEPVFDAVPDPSAPKRKRGKRGG